jgi:hypothetical protein
MIALLLLSLIGVSMATISWVWVRCFDDIDYKGEDLLDEEKAK